MFQNLKNIAVVSGSTIGSRVLGLIRDILVFAALGTSVWNSAFILAFTLPNLFRRLLGEGALTSALVPVFSDLLEREGRAGAFRFFNQVLARLLPLLLVLVAAGMLLLGWLSGQDWLPERWVTGTGLAVWLLPYMLLVCLAAVFSAGLNLVGRFAVAAATPIVLNLSMIAALGIGFWQAWGPAQIVIALAAGVLMGGLLQLLLPAGDLYRQGWRPARSADSAGASRGEGDSSALGALWALFLPGLLGAAILQINILVSRLLAFGLEESAVSVLYLASRLMELPLGVFTIAVATVFFPALSAACSREDATGFAQAFLQGLRLVVVFSVPAGVGLAVLGGPILETLFLWGAFQAEDVTATLPLLAIYALGLPFYSVATFATRGLHAHKDMRTPVRVAAIALGINLVASLILMQLLGVLGLALANVLSAVGQSLLLWRALAEGRPLIRFAALRPSLLKVLGAGAIMGLGCAALAAILEATLAAPKLVAGLTVLLGVPAGAAAYFCLLSLLRFEEMDAVRRLLRRRLGLSSE